MNVLKSISSSYVLNMIENMVLTSYLDKSYFVANYGEYVASIQVMSRDKLKHQARRQLYLVARLNFHVASVVTLYHECKTSKCCNRCIFSLITPAACSSIQKFDNECDVIFIFKM